MGQKVSSEEPSGLPHGKGDTQGLRIRPKTLIGDGRPEAFTPHTLENNFAESSDSEMQLEMDDDDDDDEDGRMARDSEKASDALVDLTIRKRLQEREAEFNKKSSLKAELVANPSIAEIGQLAALKMMQNFDDLGKVKNMLHLQNEMKEVSEKFLEDDLSEKDFRTISYEDLNAMHEDRKRDNSTYTSESKGVTLEITDSAGISSEDNLSCKDESGLSESPEAESSDYSTKYDTDADDEDELTTLKADEDEDEEEEEDDDYHNDLMEYRNDIVVLELKEKLDKLAFERDEARLRLKVAERRCEAYEKESKCLEATLNSMEEKLRTIVAELNVEVKKSKELEEQLLQALRNASSSLTPLEPLESVG